MDKVTNRITALRKARGLNQADLAEMIGVSQPHVSRIEKGDAGIPISTFMQVAQALGVTIADLFCNDRAKAEDVLLKAFRDLPPHRQQGWIDMAKAVQLEMPPSEREGRKTENPSVPK